MGGPELWAILPARNEAARIGDVLVRARALGLGLVLVVVDDASLDGTARRAREAGAQVVRHPIHLGYGAALQTGYKHVLAQGARYAVQLDADGQHPPEEIPRLLEPVRAGESDLVLGSRFLGEANYRISPLRTLGRKLFGGLAQLAGLAVTDPTSGFQALNRRALQLLVGDWFPLDYPDVDVLVALHRAGLRVREVGVRMEASPRPSRLHSGLAPALYGYKMLLSLWAATGPHHGSGAETEDRRNDPSIPR